MQGRTNFDKKLEPYIDFVLNEEVLQQRHDIIMYPERTNMFPEATQRRYDEFRNTWILVARMRPVVPCPEHTPFPDRKRTKSNRAKLLNIYLRPWTLVKSDATVAVPFLRDLDLTPEQWQLLHNDSDFSRPQVKHRLSKKTTIPDPPSSTTTSYPLDFVRDDRTA